MMLTVQTIIGSVEPDRRNGSSQSKYQGYTTGAHKRDAAIGQANASAGNAAGFLPAVLIHTAVRKPTNTASPTASCGAAIRSNIANTGSLNRKLRTKVPSEPIGICPWFRNGMLRNGM